jgi:pyrrolysine biosynthesis protein PylC
MKVTVIGGRLQGIEATYLAHKAQWEVILVDKDPDAPARTICDTFLNMDVTDNIPQISDAIKEADLIIPAAENPHILRSLHETAKSSGVPLAYDRDAYSISSSKIKSNILFKKIGISIPKEWPGCELPLIFKPSCSSGSRGAKKINCIKELEKVTNTFGYSPCDAVIQEFITGPIYSIEVFGFQDHYCTGQITKIETDNSFDCKRVLAPADLSDEQINNFEECSLRIAKVLKLKGIMDVEAILHENQFKVIEIDARLPSQTPTAVYHSTGINYLKVLCDIFCKKITPEIPSRSHENAVIYEHVRVSSGELAILGEHILSDAGALTLTTDFFGADEALTNYRPGIADWVATLIIKESTKEALWKKHTHVIGSIKKGIKLKSKII